MIHFYCCRCLRRRRLDLWCHILVAGAAQRNINRWMRIGDWPSSHVMRIMSVELLTPARLVIEYPIMHYYGIPRDIQSMTGHDIIIHVWLWLSISGNSSSYCIMGIFFNHALWTSTWIRKKRFCWRTCLLSLPSKIVLLSLHDLEHKWDKRKSTQTGCLVQAIEGRATDILVVQSSPV